MAFVLGISGKRGSGKSLLCDPYLKMRGFQVFSFADPLKEDVRKAYGLTKEHTDGKLKELPCDKLGGLTPREAMIAEGEIRRRFSTNGLYWVKKLFEEKIKFLRKEDWVVISDVRFKNEANYIKQNGGTLIRLERSKALNIYKNEISDPSEEELDSYNFNITLPEEKNATPQDLELFSDTIRTYVLNSINDSSFIY